MMEKRNCDIFRQPTMNDVSNCGSKDNKDPYNISKRFNLRYLGSMFKEGQETLFLFHESSPYNTKFYIYKDKTMIELQKAPEGIRNGGKYIYADK